MDRQLSLRPQLKSGFCLVAASNLILVKLSPPFGFFFGFRSLTWRLLLLVFDAGICFLSFWVGRAGCARLPCFLLTAAAERLNRSGQGIEFHSTAATVFADVRRSSTESMIHRPNAERARRGIPG